MRNKYTSTNFIKVLALVLAVLVAGPVAAFGQRGGKAKGGDRGGGRHEQRQQQNAFRKEQKQQEHADRKFQVQHQRADWNSRVQQNRGYQEALRQQRRIDSDARRQQAMIDWNARRQQEINNREARRQQSMIDWNLRRQQEQINQARRQQQAIERRTYAQQSWGDRRGRREMNRQVTVYPAQTVWTNIVTGGQVDPRFYGGNWGSQRRFYNQQRKAQRDFEKYQRRLARNYNRQFDNNYYAGNYYYPNVAYNNYNGGTNWKEQIVRVLIANVIGNRLGGDQYAYVPQYSPVYRSQPYYGSTYYRTTPQYVRGYDLPYSYQPVYGNGLFGGGLGASGLLGSLPIAALIQQYTGDGFASELIGNILAQGYDQGYIAGQQARRNGYGNRYYQDPYVLDGGVYDPYSVTVGENRRCLSEGYRLGYQDALNGQIGYDPRANGNIDLVSLLVSNVLGNV